MSKVLERPEATADTTSDSLPDFEPMCCISTQLPMLTEPVPCEHPAKWVGFTPCCGTVGLICEHHRFNHGPFRCGPCGRHSEDLIGWQRL